MVLHGSICDRAWRFSGYLCFHCFDCVDKTFMVYFLEEESNFRVLGHLLPMQVIDVVHLLTFCEEGLER